MKKFSFLIFPLTALLMVPVSSSALTPPQKQSPFRQVIDLGRPDILVPTVVEVPLGKEIIESPQFAVLDQTSSTYQPYYFKAEAVEIPEHLGISSSDKTSPTIRNLIDGDMITYHDFKLPSAGAGQITIELISPQAVTSSLITLWPDRHVSLPDTVKITAIDENREETIIVAEKKVTSFQIPFPRTTSHQWTINLTYSQPLRLTEVSLNPENPERERTVRFLAQANHNYQLYLNPDRAVNLPRSEAGNLNSDQDVLILLAPPSQPNPVYIAADVDQDGVPDASDNCKNIPNPDQLDINRNNIGDACDDFDQDSIINSQDNCPNLPNQNQRDEDGDGLGDVCDQEESRVTERHPWIPWAGIGFAVLVVVTLLILTVGHKPNPSPLPPSSPPSPPSPPPA